MIYYIIIAMLICLTYLEWSGKDNNILGDKNMEKYCYVFMATLLTLIAALRYETGRDWSAYIPYFEECLTMTNSGVFEPGYYWLNIVFKKLFNDYYVMQFTISVFYGFAIYSYIYRKAVRPVLVLLAYMLFCYFFVIDMAIQRNMIAMGIIIFGMQFVEKRQLVKWIITILVALQFHVTSFFAFPLYFTTGYKISKKTAFTMYIWIVAVFLLSQGIIWLCVKYASESILLPGRIRTIAAAYMQDARYSSRAGYASLIGALAHNFFYILVLLLYKEDSAFDSKYIVNFLLAILCINIGRNFAILTRVSYYYMLCGGGIFMYSIFGRRSLQVGKKRLTKGAACCCSFIILTLFITAYSAQVYRAFNGSQEALEFKHDYVYYKNFITK